MIKPIKETAVKTCRKFDRAFKRGRWSKQKAANKNQEAEVKIKNRVKQPEGGGETRGISISSAGTSELVQA